MRIDADDALEGRGVAALGKSDSQGVAGAVGLVVLGQLRPQAPRLHSDNRVQPRIVLRWTVEHFDAQQVLLELVALAIERALDDESQHPAEPPGVDERLAGQHVFKGRAHVGGIDRRHR